MKITLLITSFNSLSQAVYTSLKERDISVDVVYINSSSIDEEIADFDPDLILSPFLKHFIPATIYEQYPTYVFHPGIIGDRGACSLEWALQQECDVWGGVWLRANALYDGGDIYASGTFKLRESYKASIYRQEELTLAVRLLDELFETISSGCKRPQLLDEIRPCFDVVLDWEQDTTKEIIKKIHLLDSHPGVKETILGLECHLFGAWEEAHLKGAHPKEILAKRDGAICLSTIDGALWITHLKAPDGFKLPATYLLKERLKGVKEQRLPLIFDRSYQTFYEISSSIDGDIAYLHFNFHNGAMSANQCIRLKYAFEHLKESAKIIVLLGGADFFSNGIHLNILQDSKKNGEDGWSNINAMNELVQSILFADDVITIASLHRNSGAGGLFLALACDYVVASPYAVLNPHYKSLGLSGSEYHTYTLPKRVGQKEAQRLLDACLPVGAKEAKKIGLIDEIFSDEGYFESVEAFSKALLEDEDAWDAFLDEKEASLDANRAVIEHSRECEIEVMYPEFWEESSPFHTLRYDFVYKICPTQTPKRLKYHA
jgi:putative two-component system hydrogenase maturation factor HypX/HoxX